MTVRALPRWRWGSAAVGSACASPAGSIAARTPPTYAPQTTAAERWGWGLPLVADDLRLTTPAVGRPHGPRRIRAWTSLFRASSFTTAGRAGVAGRLRGRPSGAAA